VWWELKETFSLKEYCKNNDGFCLQRDKCSTRAARVIEAAGPFEYSAGPFLPFVDAQKNK